MIPGCILQKKVCFILFISSSFQGEGVRVAINLRYDLNTHWMVIAKFGQTIYMNRSEIGSGYDLIASNKKADLQMQLRLKF